MNSSTTVVIPTKPNKNGEWEVTIEYADGLIKVKTFPVYASWKEMIDYLSQRYGNCNYKIISFPTSQPQKNVSSNSNGEG